MGNKSKRRKTALRKWRTERYRTVNGVVYDCNDKEQYLAYRRARYRAEKLKRALNAGAGEAAPEQEETP